MFYFKNQLAGHVIPQPTTTVVVIHSIERPFLVLLPQQFVPVSRCPGSSTHPSVSVDVRPLCRLLPRHVSPSPTPPALCRCVATDRAVFFMALHRPLLLFAAPGAGSALRAPCRAIGVPFARSSCGVPSRPSCAGRRAMRPAAAVVVVVIDQGGRAAGPSRAPPSGGATPKALCPVVPSPSLGGLALAPPPQPLPPCAAVDVHSVRSIRTARHGVPPSRGSVPPSVLAAFNYESFRRGRRTNAFSPSPSRPPSSPPPPPPPPYPPSSRCWGRSDVTSTAAHQ